MHLILSSYNTDHYTETRDESLNLERAKVLRLTEELKKLVKESHDLKKKLAGPEETIELYDFKWIDEMRVETLKQANPEAKSKAERWNLEKKMAKKLESLKMRLNEKVVSCFNALKIILLIYCLDEGVGGL